MLDPRLLCVAKHIRRGSVLADIGTDHAHLPVYLVERGVCPRAIASDLRPGPAEAARKSIRAAGLTDMVEVRIGDGLTPVAAGEVDDIAVAGMGGETIAGILEACPWIRDPRYRLVLQPMTRPEELRRYLYTAGFSIQEEEIVRDGHRLYTVIAAAYTGECLEPGPALLHIGRISRGETAYLSRIRDRLLRQAAGLSRAEDLSRRREAEALRRTAGWIGRYMEGTWTPASETAMTVTWHTDAAAFREAVWELLLANEAEHNLLIDSVRAAVDQGAAMEWMAVVRDETAVRLIALRRPPYHLVACEPAGPCPAASEALCRSLASAFPAAAFPGVIAPAGLAERLAKGMASRIGRQPRRTHEMSVLTLRQPAPLSEPDGRFRQAADSDRLLLAAWHTAFGRECRVGGRNAGASLAHVDALLRAGRQFVWENGAGVPVSMAEYGRDLPHGMAVAAVYTPPEERGRGYATALVTALCRRVLAMGKAYVCLFVDDRNPISNHVYEKIGFRRAGTQEEWGLEERDGEEDGP